MSSKWHLSLVFILCGLLTSCLPVGDKVAIAPKTETKIGVEAQCLKGTLPTIEAFMNGSADSGKVEDIWTCFDDALGLFKERVRSENPRFYSSREVASFFEDYFLDGVKINDRLLVEVMRIKQLVVGGENTKMTPAELDHLRKFARHMKGLSLRLLPQMKILAMNWQVTGEDDFKEDLARFEEARNIGLEVIESLAGWIAPQKQSYRLESLVVLMEELQAVSGKEWGATTSLKKMIPLLSKLKGAMTGTEESTIDPEDWLKFGRLGARAYFQYLRYYYFFENNSNGDDGPQLFLVFKSIDDLFAVVSDVLQEKTGGKLVREEILSVMDAVHQVFPQFRLSEDLLSELLRLKVLFIGGEADSLTPEDLARARLKLGPFETITQLFQDNSEIFELKWDHTNLGEDEARTRLKDAGAALQNIAVLTGGLFESSYDLQSLADLVKSYEAVFPPSDKKRSLTKRITKLMPVLQTGKEIILADRGSAVDRSDFPRLLDTLARSYSVYMEYSYFLKSESILRQPGHFEPWIKSIEELAQHILLVRGHGQVKIITDAELIHLVEAVDKSELLPKGVTRQTLEILVPIVTKRFLSTPEERISGQFEKGIGPRGIRNIAGEIGTWIGVQKRLNAVKEADPRLFHTGLVEQFTSSSTNGDIEFFNVINSPMSLAFDAFGRLHIGHRSEIAYSQHSLDVLNLIRGGARWVIRSYGDSVSKTGLAGLTDKQFYGLIEDFRPLAVQLGLIEPDNLSFAVSRFMEGNLFTAFSDGDDFLDFSEASNLAALIVSGINTHSLLEARLIKDCQVKHPTVLSVNVDCAMDVIRDEASRVFESMPRMVEMLNGDAKVAKAFIQNVLNAAGWAPNKERIAPLSDVALVPHVFQYIESLFKRWDRNGDGFLDREEAAKAEVLFRPMIKKVSNLNDDEMLRAAFAYILVNGKPPETYWEMTQFYIWWVGQDATWKIKENRAKVGQILAFIADSVRSGNRFQVPVEELKKQQGLKPPALIVE